jgi:hypothetical protein
MDKVSSQKSTFRLKMIITNLGAVPDNMKKCYKVEYEKEQIK